MDLRPNAQRAKNAITLIWIVLLTQMLSLGSSIMQYDLLSDMSGMEMPDEETISANDTREMVTGLLAMAAYIVSAVFFIQWFRRAYFNLHLRSHNLRYPEGWAAGSWFVPILNWFRPYQIMRELCERTASYLQEKSLPHQAVPYGLVGWWWAVWVISAVVGQIALRTGISADSIEEISANTVVYIVAGVIEIPLAFLTIAVIKNYARMEALFALTKQEPVDVLPSTT